MLSKKQFLWFSVISKLETLSSHNGTQSGFENIISGVPQRSVVVWVLFSLYFNDALFVINKSQFIILLIITKCNLKTQNSVSKLKEKELKHLISWIIRYSDRPDYIKFLSQQSYHAKLVLNTSKISNQLGSARKKMKLKIRMAYLVIV